jgi:bacteriochlorophyllide a dehydrogenase
MSTLLTDAVILSGPRALGVQTLGLVRPKAGDVVVEVTHSGISTGTEKLFWSGTMPPFPGMGYPLVPGYEAVGEVGDRVFVPGANCFENNVRGLFGAAARHLVTPAARAIRVDAGLQAEGALLALAATARHAIAGFNTALPDLIVGHGTLGRLLARLTIAAGGQPVVWETNPARRTGAVGYTVIDPDTDSRRDYRAIYDASGAPGLLDTLVRHVAKGGEIVLAGFYAEPVSFAFPPAFMKEARFRIAAEWQPDDIAAVRTLLDAGTLSLSGLVSHTAPAADAPRAYDTAFTDPNCLKMILDWSGHA